MEKNIIIDKIRVQILANEIVRIEYNEKKEFLDENTFFIPNRSQLVSNVNYTINSFNDYTSISLDDIDIEIPNISNKLNGIRIINKKGECLYKYKDLKNTGELPSLSKTPYIFPLIDSPRIVCPEKGYSALNNKEEYKIEKKAKDLYLFICRKDAKKLRKQYVELTGRNEMVRLSTLGMWNSRYYKYDEDTAKKMIEDHEKYNIPLDNLVIDTDWRKASDRGIGYDIDTNLFPDMKAFMDYAHSKNVEIMFNDHPEPVEGAKNVLSRKEIKYREEKLQGLLEIGLDYWWYDRNWRTKLISPVKEINPETFGLYLFENVTANYFKKIAKDETKYRRPIIMGNINDILNGDYLGIKDSASHRYSIQWTGDIGCNDENLLQEIKTLVQASNNCVGYVNFDCGGHVGNPDKELYLRWMKFGAFSPIYRPHCNIAVIRYREPWNYDDETVDIVREYVNMRYHLLPLLYQRAFENYNTGEPICKSVGLSFPNDKQALKCTTQYMIGDNILVSPIYGEPLTIVPKKNFIKPIKTKFFQNRELEGDAIVNKTYKFINQVYDKNSPDEKIKPYDFSAIFETEICFKEDVDLYICNDDGTRVYLDDALVLDDWKCHHAFPQFVARLEKNRIYKFKMDYFQGGDKSVIKVLYKLVKKDNHNDKYGDRRHKFYLPEGTWINVFTGEKFIGPKSFTRKFNLKQFPVFVKEGTIIPLAKSARTTKEQYWNELTLDIYPSKNGSYQGYIYEDDTITTGYKNGEYRIQKYDLSYDQNENALVVKLNKAEGEFEGNRCFDERKVYYRCHLLNGFNDINSVELNNQRVDFKELRKNSKNYPFNFKESTPDGKILIVESSLSIKEDNVLKIYLN